MGLPVYAIANGKYLGLIAGLLVRREDCSVPVISIRDGGSGKDALLPYSALVTVGVDIALVASPEVLDATISPEVLHDLEIGLPGRPVFTQGGESAGKVVGFGLDTTNGHITDFRVEANAGFWDKLLALGRDKTVDIPTTLVLSLGPVAVIVENAAMGLLNPS